MEVPPPSHQDSNERNLKKAQNYRPSPEAKSRTKLGAVLKLDSLERSYDDIHPQNSKNLGNELSKSKGCRQKKKVETNSHSNEELVMYMSNVPSYLERGENPWEKTFNVGVLDWSLLKKWENNRKDESPVRGKELLFSGNISTFVASEKSPAACSSRGYSHSSTVPRQRVHRPSSSHHVKSPSSEKCVRGITHLNEDGEKFQRCKNSLARALDVPQGALPENGPHSLDDVHNRNVSVLKLKDTIHDGKCFFSAPAHDCVESHQDTMRMQNTKSSEDARFEVNQNASASGSISVPSTRTKNGKEDSDPDRENVNENACSQAKTVISDSASNQLPTSCSSSSSCDVPNNTNRSRSSPLRRLLDPLLKPISGNSRHSVKSRKPSTTNEAIKSSEGSKKSQATCQTKVISDSKEDLKNGSSIVQALMQVVVKNGIPLFSFTVDNCSDILAATVKESYSPKRKTKRWIYTFFSFKETKKRNGYWIYQGSKDRNHEYVSNVIAQMKVSDASDTDPHRQKSMTREFVLFSVGPSGKTSESLPGEELAAIIIKYPENPNGELTGALDKPSALGMNEPIREHGDSSFNATVLLPGGDHGVPSKGEPSPLIKRWKTGGLCDCGGWDLGCRIRTLTNNSSSSRSRSTDGFNPTENRSSAGLLELFFEEEADEKRASLILSLYKDGVFSLQFDTSIKHIQAFSIVLAVLNRTTSAVFSADMLGEERAAGTGTGSLETASTPSLQEISAKYTSFPPVSPFGRV